MRAKSSARAPTCLAKMVERGICLSPRLCAGNVMHVNSQSSAARDALLAILTLGLHMQACVQMPCLSTVDEATMIKQWNKGCMRHPPSALDQDNAAVVLHSVSAQCRGVVPTCLVPSMALCHVETMDPRLGTAEPSLWGAARPSPRTSGCELQELPMLMNT